MTAALQVHEADGVLQLTLSRPQARNALDGELLAALEAASAAIDVERVRVVILRGTGGHFCAGADLKELQAAVHSGERAAVVQYNRRYGALLRRFAALPMILIVIAEGAVLGGGFGLVCVSDFALAHVDAQFALPETRRGLLPAQIAPFVVQRIGLTQARRLCLSGMAIDGRAAQTLGLVHQTFADDADLQAQLQQLLAALRQCAPQATCATKALLCRAAGEAGDIDALLDRAAADFAAAACGDEARAGIAAFKARHLPPWAQPPGACQ